MKKVLSILLILALTFTLVSCTQEKEPESEKKEKLLLGLSFASLDALYFQAQKERAEKAATELGFDIVIAVADNDSNKQLQQCEDMLTQKVDALLVVPVDKVAIVSVVDACVEKQIPYIAVGRMPEDMTNVAFAAKGDNIDRAWESAKLIRKIADDMGKTGTIKVIEMIGNLTDQAAVERHQGFVEASVKYNLEIVGEVNTEWDTEKAYNRFNDLMQVVDKFDAVYMPSDMLISGCFSVLEKEGLYFPVGDPKHIIVCGTDADAYAVSEVSKRNLDFSVAADAFETIMTAITTTLEILDGKMPAEKIHIVPTSCVATWNVDEIIKNKSTWGTLGVDEYLAK